MQKRKTMFRNQAILGEVYGILNIKTIKQYLFPVFLSRCQLL